jgi:hypothetical protein
MKNRLTRSVLALFATLALLVGFSASSAQAVENWCNPYPGHVHSPAKPLRAYSAQNAYTKWWTHYIYDFRVYDLGGWESWSGKYDALGMYTNGVRYRDVWINYSYMGATVYGKLGQKRTFGGKWRNDGLIFDTTRYCNTSPF